MALNLFALVQQRTTAKCATCHREAVDLCECPCQQLYYCDVRCQQDDWARHRLECTKARRGKLPQSLCTYCGIESVSLKSCRCDAAFYCSFECQRLHYGVHGRTCSATVGSKFKKRRRRSLAQPDASLATDIGSMSFSPSATTTSTLVAPRSNGAAPEIAGGERVSTESQTLETCQSLISNFKRMSLVPEQERPRASRSNSVDRAFDAAAGTSAEIKFESTAVVERSLGENSMEGLENPLALPSQ